MAGLKSYHWNSGELFFIPAFFFTIVKYLFFGDQRFGISSFYIKNDFLSLL